MWWWWGGSYPSRTRVFTVSTLLGDDGSFLEMEITAYLFVQWKWRRIFLAYNMRSLSSFFTCFMIVLRFYGERFSHKGRNYNPNLSNHTQVRIWDVHKPRKKGSAQIAPKRFAAVVSTARKDPPIFPLQEKIRHYRTKVSLWWNQNWGLRWPSRGQICYCLRPSKGKSRWKWETMIL